jgi:hypothetical protein
MLLLPRLIVRGIDVQHARLPKQRPHTFTRRQDRLCRLQVAQKGHLADYLLLVGAPTLSITKRILRRSDYSLKTTTKV